jgi:hypothetical protein
MPAAIAVKCTTITRASAAARLGGETSKTLPASHSITQAMQVNTTGTPTTQATSMARSFTLTLCFTAARTRTATTVARMRAGKAGKNDRSTPAADTGARLKTIHASATMVGSHARGEPKSKSAPNASATIIRTTIIFGSAADMNNWRMRPAFVSGAGMRRAFAFDPALRATRSAELCGFCVAVACGARGARSVCTVRPRAWLRGRGVDRDWGLVFLFIGVHFATFCAR